MLRPLKFLGERLKEGFEKNDWPDLEFDADDRDALKKCGFALNKLLKECGDNLHAIGCPSRSFGR